MSEQAFTPVQRVLRYYPQRVQVMAMAALNLFFVSLAEFSTAEPSVLFVSTINAFVLALLVFFYGEPKTSSKQFIEDSGGLGRIDGEGSPV